MHDVGTFEDPGGLGAVAAGCMAGPLLGLLFALL